MGIIESPRYKKLRCCLAKEIGSSLRADVSYFLHAFPREAKEIGDVCKQGNRL